MLWFLLLITAYAAWVWFSRRDIIINNELYLRRFFLTPRLLPRRVFLHYIRLSDAGRDLHDHPWDWTGLILKGGYTELLPNEKTRVVKRLSVVLNKAEHTHRVVLTKPAITLLWVSPARREWGFHTPLGWVPWYEYMHVDNVPAPEDKRRISQS